MFNKLIVDDWFLAQMEGKWMSIFNISPHNTIHIVNIHSNVSSKKNFVISH